MFSVLTLTFNLNFILILILALAYRYAYTDWKRLQSGFPVIIIDFIHKEYVIHNGTDA